MVARPTAPQGTGPQVMTAGGTGARRPPPKGAGPACVFGNRAAPNPLVPGPVAVR